MSPLLSAVIADVGCIVELADVQYLVVCRLLPFRVSRRRTYSLSSSSLILKLTTDHRTTPPGLSRLTSYDLCISNRLGLHFHVGFSCGMC